MKLYSRQNAAKDWHFLTGEQHSIDKLTGDVGFRFAYDAASRQFAHPSGLVILTPEGKISTYFLGLISCRAIWMRRCGRRRRIARAK